jgi:hypothetical protein
VEDAVSHALLLELEARRAFEATRRFEDLELVHVAFDEITGSPTTEAALARAAAHGGRVAIIGGSGSGKSSIIASVLGPFANHVPEDVVPLRIPVAAEGEDVVGHSPAFARHVVATITRWASPELFTDADRQRFERAAADRLRAHGRQLSRRFHVGAPGWLADAGFAVEVRSTGEDIERRSSGADVIAESTRMIELFRSFGRSPLLVIDDSDSWLRIADLDRSDVAEAFFRENVRMIATELDCGLVVAVHEDYLDLPGFVQAERFLSTTVAVPRFDTDAAQPAIRKILQRRMEVHGVHAMVADVFDDEAMSGLEWHYHMGASLRDVLVVADRSLQHACSDFAARITKGLVLQGMAEL